MPSMPAICISRGACGRSALIRHNSRFVTLLVLSCLLPMRVHADPPGRAPDLSRAPGPPARAIDGRRRQIQNLMAETPTMRPCVPEEPVVPLRSALVMVTLLTLPPQPKSTPRLHVVPAAGELKVVLVAL